MERLLVEDGAKQSYPTRTPQYPEAPIVLLA
jgi:hypothetical protein